jgi:hypothetical protein
MSPVGLRIIDHCAGEGQRQFNNLCERKGLLGRPWNKSNINNKNVNLNLGTTGGDFIQWALVRFSGELLCPYGHGEQPFGSTKVAEFLDQSSYAQGKFRTTERWLLRLQFGSELQSFIMFVSIAMVVNMATLQRHASQDSTVHFHGKLILLSGFHLWTMRNTALMKTVYILLG